MNPVILMPSIIVRRLIILLLLLIQCYFVRAQPLWFTKFQQDDFVTTIFQDSRGFLWLGTPAGLQRYDGYHFKKFQYDETDTLSLINNEVWNMVEDDMGQLWVGTNNGLCRLDPSQEIFTRFRSDPRQPDALTNDQIFDLLADTAGTVWVATANGLNRYLLPTRRFKRYLYESQPTEDRPFRTSRTPIQSRNGTIWVGVQDTLFRYDATTDRFSGIRLPGNDAAANSIRLIYEDQAGDLWIGTQLNGAFRFDPRRSTFLEHYKNDSENANSLSQNKVSAFIQNTNEIWIGTSGGGLNVLNLKTGQITRHTGTPPDPFGVNSETIRDAWEDDRGNIWLGSYYDGLYQFKRSQRIFRNFDQNSGLLSKKVNDIEETADGKIWIAMGTGGLAVFDPKRNEFTDYYQNDPKNNNGLPPGSLLRMRKDKAGQLWVASATGGLSRIDPESNTFDLQLPRQQDDLPYLDQLTDFLVEENGDIWIARQTGLAKYIRESRSFKTYLLPDKDNTTIDYGENSYVTSIYRDRFKQFWFSTYGGINLYRPETDSFEFFPFKYQVQGLLEDSSGGFWIGTRGGLFKFDRDKRVFSKAVFTGGAIPLLEDRNGKIWLSNHLHVIRYDPVTDKATLLDRQDGLAGNHFWTNHLSEGGLLFLGGIDGLTVFHPDSLQNLTQPPRMVLTDFRLFNKTVPLQGSPGDTLAWESPLAQNITFTKNIQLRHWQNYFSLEFAALDFTAPANNRYQYQLEGYDKDWVTTDAERRFVTYTNLDPGTYTFRVKGATRNSTWSTEAATLEIRILPPWWRTWWAYLLFASLCFLLIRTVYQFQLNRRVALSEAQRLRELDQAKNRLLTNVTHEFRTPLTVIMGMAEKIEETPQIWLTEGIQAIRRNGRQVLKLVNQMLDLSRLEAGSLSLAFQQGDVITYLSYLVQSHQSYAASKDIRLLIDKRLETLVMDFSADALSKIVNNLLSNAIKFTPPDGKITVTLNQTDDQLVFEVHDTGKGIDREDLPHVFDRFYQADAGSTRRAEGAGIGLALVKELVTHLNGQIQVKSTLGEGTTFRVDLPISRQAPLDTTSVPNLTPETSNVRHTLLDQSEQTSSDLPLVLLVEDNEDVARYTAACLTGRYQVHWASNGRAGVERALDLIPDLLICDIMMPEMDGYEVCRILKTDDRTSHIPIVMLTAKADMDSRLEGLRQGADAYLAKPFHPEELDLRLDNLFQLRQKIRQHFERFPTTQISDADYPKEHEFLKKIKSILHAHLDQETFGIPELCRELGISRTQLHRKLKAITGLSTSHVIRAIRMDEAKRLLLETDEQITQIAYRVGFSNASYFSTIFVEVYGQSPSKMREGEGSL